VYVYVFLVMLSLLTSNHLLILVIESFLMSGFI